MVLAARTSSTRFPDSEAGLRVEPGGEFVEEDQFGGVDQGQGHEHALTLTTGQILNQGVTLVPRPRRDISTGQSAGSS